MKQSIKIHTGKMPSNRKSSPPKQEETKGEVPPVKGMDAGETNDEDESVASTDAVPVPEEFQHATHKLVHKATKPQLAHVRDRVNQRDDELRQQEMDEQDDQTPTIAPDNY